MDRDRPTDRRFPSWLLAAALVAASCGEAERAPPLPFGGDLSASPPYRDVLGFARLLPERLPAGEPLAAWAGEQARLLASVVSPVTEVIELLQQPGVLAAGSPLVVLFLDSKVHGEPFAFAFRGSAAALRRAAEDRADVDCESDGDALRFQPRRPLPQIQGLLPMFRNVRMEAPPPTGRYWVEAEDSEGAVLLLPARDGRRNVRATLKSSGALDEQLEWQEVFNLDFDRVMARVRQDLETFFSVIPAALNLMGGQGRDMPGRMFFGFPQIARVGLDALESVDHLFVGRRASSRVDVYARTVPAGPADCWAAVLDRRSLEELCLELPPSTISFSVATHPNRLQERFSTDFRQRRRSRHRLLPIEPQASGAAPPLSQFFDGRFWATVGLEGAPFEGVRITAPLSLDGAGAEDLREVASGHLAGFLQQISRGLVSGAIRYQLRGEEVEDGGVLDAVDLSVGPRSLSLAALYFSSVFELVYATDSLEAARRQPRLLEVPARLDFTSDLDVADWPDELSAVLLGSFGRDRIVGAAWRDAQGLVATFQHLER